MTVTETLGTRTAGLDEVEADELKAKVDGYHGRVGMQCDFYLAELRELIGKMRTPEGGVYREVWKPLDMRCSKFEAMESGCAHGITIR